MVSLEKTWDDSCRNGDIRGSKEKGIPGGPSRVTTTEAWLRRPVSSSTTVGERFKPNGEACQGITGGTSEECALYGNPA